MGKKARPAGELFCDALSPAAGHDDLASPGGFLDLFPGQVVGEVE
jgi:hypothetical protein